MHEGTWTIRPCPHRVQAELASSLGISELTAGVVGLSHCEYPPVFDDLLVTSAP